jgi:von Willebrand factor type A domain
MGYLMLKRPASEVDHDPIDADVIDAVDSADAEALESECPEDPSADAESPTWLDADMQAFIVSMMVHLVLILSLAVIPMVAQQTNNDLELSVYPPLDLTEEFSLIDNVAFSDAPATEVGANSTSDTDGSMALSAAPILAEVSEVVAPSFDTPAPNANFDLDVQLKASVGLTRSDVVVKGMTGYGATGTDGAVDRITYEILRSMEERPTLVVWFFDQSGSLQKRRKEVRDRFDRIYEELGIVSAVKEEAIKAKANGQEPLLTSIFAFGHKVNLLTQKPTADIGEIRQAIDSIETDQTGIEKVFSAIFLAVGKYKSYRTGRDARNVIFVAVTDERGDDADGLEATIKECRKFAIPVYVVGVPSPFGREFTYVKYVDPDPKFDQSTQWAQVDQGPESLLPERVKLGYKDDYFEEPVVDSGFGPYALSRLAYETGGIYFTVHANRQFDHRVSKREIGVFESNIEYFFDPEVMVKYRPDYESLDEYKKQVGAGGNARKTYFAVHPARRSGAYQCADAGPATSRATGTSVRCPGSGIAGCGKQPRQRGITTLDGGLRFGPGYRSGS